MDTRPDKPGSDAQLFVVSRIGWAAAVCGVKQLAEQCARRATTSQVVPYNIFPQHMVPAAVHGRFAVATSLQQYTLEQTAASFFLIDIVDPTGKSCRKH